MFNNTKCLITLNLDISRGNKIFYAKLKTSSAVTVQSRFYISVRKCKILIINFRLDFISCSCKSIKEDVDTRLKYIECSAT